MPYQPRLPLDEEPVRSELPLEAQPYRPEDPPLVRETESKPPRGGVIPRPRQRYGAGRRRKEIPFEERHRQYTAQNVEALAAAAADELARRP